MKETEEEVDKSLFEIAFFMSMEWSCLFQKRKLLFYVQMCGELQKETEDREK